MSDIATILGKLGDHSQPIQHRTLRQLSDLGSDSDGELLRVWRPIGVERRRALVKAMTGLAEDSVEFDFRDVFQALLADEDAEVREAAVDGLWEDERPRTLRRLLALLGDDPDSDVRAAVALVLGHFAQRAELGELRAELAAELRTTLLDAAGLTNPDTEVRRRVVESAGYFTDPEITELIKDAYATGLQPFKESALAAIGHNLDPRWLPVLSVELKSSTAALRYEAARAAGEFGTEGHSLLPLLLPLTEDGDPEVMSTAVWALGQIGGGAAERALQRLVQSDDLVIQQVAEEALAELHFADDASRLI
ncbi:MAG: HEAT repeat domain-containing protein [Herpetosiphonaceae bacterium]|nr:HEAT repeat domain-containing protein [Herpetosiphonaceae bacterium]